MRCSPPSGRDSFALGFNPAKASPGSDTTCSAGRLRRSKPIASAVTGAAKPGTPGPDHVGIGFGDLSSDEPLTYTDEFPPMASSKSISIIGVTFATNRLPESPSWLRPRSASTGWVGSPRQAHVRRFSPDKPVSVTIPRAAGRRFVAFDATGTRSPPAESWRLRHHGWDTGYRAEIQLPCPPPSGNRARSLRGKGTSDHRP